MERRINKKIESHFVDFKSQIIDRLKQCHDDIESNSDIYKLVEFIYNFPKIDINAEERTLTNSKNKGIVTTGVKVFLPLVA